jgi:hypothetical protein
MFFRPRPARRRAGRCAPPRGLGPNRAAPPAVARTRGSDRAAGPCGRLRAGRGSPGPAGAPAGGRRGSESRAASRGRSRAGRPRSVSGVPRRARTPGARNCSRRLPGRRAPLRDGPHTRPPRHPPPRSARRRRAEQPPPPQAVASPPRASDPGRAGLRAGPGLPPRRWAIDSESGIGAHASGGWWSVGGAAVWPARPAGPTGPTPPLGARPNQPPPPPPPGSQPARPCRPG